MVICPKTAFLFFNVHIMRSMRAAQVFLEKGFENVYMVNGGIHAWSLHVDPDVATY